MSGTRKPPTSRPPGGETAGGEERSTLDVLRGIKEGRTDPKLLSPEDRQACVSHLGAEGLSVPEIAQVLKVSDRTIARDRRQLQSAACLEHDPRLAGELAGRLVTEAQIAIDRMRRVSREKDCPHAVRVEAERCCFGVLDAMVQRLQSLGFLPLASQRIEADVNLTQALRIPELQVQIEELFRIASTTPEATEHVPRLEGLAAITRRVVVGQEPGPEGSAEVPG